MNKRRNNRSGTTEICPMCGNPAQYYRNGARFGLGRICIGCFELCRIREETAEYEAEQRRMASRSKYEEEEPQGGGLLGRILGGHRRNR